MNDLVGRSYLFLAAQLAARTALPWHTMLMSFTTLLWIIFLMAVFLYVVYGVVLAYHWIRWSGSVATTTLAIALYGGAGALLFSIMLGALLTFSL